uniref:Uncharacterized protein n=1 Tax=Anguilla anguilla TaxID=7936 RepID=A0A0E9TE75_ANGAN
MCQTNPTLHGWMLLRLSGRSRRPMHTKEIKQRIIDKGLVQSNAKSSLEAVMYREVRHAEPCVSGSSKNMS